MDQPMDNHEALWTELIAAIDQAENSKTLEDLRVAALGKKGSVTALMKSLGGMAPDERKAAGAALNALKSEL
jgi:phenylalanyl-tRNA synthetase alpha chain